LEASQQCSNRLDGPKWSKCTNFHIAVPDE